MRGYGAARARELRELDRLAGLSPDEATDPDVGGAADSTDKKKTKGKSKGAAPPLRAVCGMLSSFDIVTA